MEMNRAELNEAIELIFDDARADYSLIPSMEGNVMKLIADYIDQEVFTRVEAEVGKSLVDDTEIARLSAVNNQDLSTYYTKTEVDGKVSSLYKFKGNAANYAALPSSNQVTGDTWNLLDTGENWAWSGITWDNLGATIDVSGKEDITNKSTDGTFADNSDLLYPSQKAVRTYVSANIPTVADTAFVNKPYTSVMSVAYTAGNPNFEIELTGALDLTLTGTVNGDSGLVNLYFSGVEIATVNGVRSLQVVGNGEMVPIYFMHDSDGLKWYKDEVNNLQVETIIFYNNTLVSGGIVSQKDLLAIDAFILKGKAAGWWATQKDMCLFLKTNGGINSAIIKLKNLAGVPIVNNGFTSADLYDFGIFPGGTFNTGKYLNLGVTMSSLGINLQDLSAAVFTPLEGSGDYRFNLGDPNNKLGAALSLFVDLNTTPAFSLACNNGDLVGTYNESNLPLGTNVITCRADGLTSFNNGVNFKDTVNVGSGTIAGTFETSRRCYGGGNAFTGNIPLSFYSIGTSMTNQQSLDMSKAVHALMVSLGRISQTNDLISFGDSILKGFAEWAVQKTYANQVARKLSLNNINMSRGERITSSASGDVLSGLDAYPNLIDFSSKTSTVLFALGTNDILTLDSNSNDFGNITNLSNFNNHCDAMLSSSLDKGQNVILVSIARMTNNLTTTSLNKQLDYVKVSASLAKSYYNRVNGVKVNFVNLYHYFLDSSTNYLLGDGVHLNEAGNLAVSKEILRVINTGVQRRNAELSFGTISAGESSSINVTVLNAEVGMSVTITPPNNLIAGLVITGFVSADDTVLVRLTNVTAANIAVLTGKFIVDVETGY